MRLTFESHQAGGITVIKCSGRIVEGAESAALQQRVNDVLSESPYIILDLGGVDFIDSSGLGLLVRCVIRTKNVHGILKVCGISPRLSEALKVTKLDTIFEAYSCEAEAIAGFYARSRAEGAAVLEASILCVEQSSDVLAYVSALLRQAGYQVVTTANLPDGLTLLTATRPRLVVVGATLRAARETRAAAAFNKLLDSLAVIELPVDFSSHDAGESGRQLLDRVRATLDAQRV